MKLYKCDRCGELIEPKEAFRVDIAMSSPDSIGYLKNVQICFNSSRHRDFCQKCVVLLKAFVEGTDVEESNEA